MNLADKFNPGKWLVENKLTNQSRLDENELNTSTNSDYKELQDLYNYITYGSDVVDDEELDYKLSKKFKIKYNTNGGLDWDAINPDNTKNVIDYMKKLYYKYFVDPKTLRPKNNIDIKQYFK